MRKCFAILCFMCLLGACDTKKVSVKGRVVNQATGEGIYNMLVTMHQCKSNGDDCEDIVIGECYTAQDGSFVIDQKTARKSKTKWITVYNTNHKIGEKDNIGVTENNLVIEVTP